MKTIRDFIKIINEHSESDYEKIAKKAGWSNAPDAIPTLPNDEGYWMHPKRWHKAGNPVTYLTAEEVVDGEDLIAADESVVEEAISGEGFYAGDVPLIKEVIATLTTLEQKLSENETTLAAAFGDDEYNLLIDAILNIMHNGELFARLRELSGE